MAIGNTVSLDALRTEIFRKDLMADVEEKMYFNVMGMAQRSPKDVAPNAVIHIVDDLKGKPGDTITIGLSAKLGKLTGVAGDYELEGRESKIVYVSEAIGINQWRDAVRLTGRLDEQKTAINMRKDAKNKLSIRIREFLEMQFFLKLGGVTNPTLTDTAGNLVAGYLADGATYNYLWSNTPDYIPTADEAAGYGPRYLNAYGGTTASMTSVDLITPDLLSKAKVKAETAHPIIEPVEYKGRKWYVVILHPWQMYDLRRNAVLAQALREAWWQGEENPLFSGASLVWNGMIIHEHPYIPFLDITVAGNSFYAAASGTDCGVDCFRALLLGKQAAAWAPVDGGAAPKWVEKDFDFGNKWAISCGVMGGVQKIMFTTDSIAKEYGVIAIDSAATAIA